MVGAECCDPGTKWSGTPAGKEVKLECGYDAYVSEPKGSKPTAAVLLIHDIHGWQVNNARLICDNFAAAGFLCILPDFFKGHKRDMSEPRDMQKIMQWLALFPHDETMANIQKVIAEVRSTYGVNSVGAEGFCWGGHYVAALLGEGGIEAGVIAHGSRVTVEDVQAIKKPVLFLFSDNDKMIPTELREQFEGILREKSHSFAAEGKFYPGMAHGWAVRGDDKDEEVANQARDAYQMAENWFKKHL